MEFHEKLDFLMNITRTSNSLLGQRVNLDSSHISRIRRGQRGPLKNEAVIALMAEYFARHCMEDYQRKAVADALQINYSSDVSELNLHIKEWLMDKKQEANKSIEDFLNSFKMTGIKPEAAQTPDTNYIHAYPAPNEITILYGNDGKRQAAEFFLNDVIAKNQPQTLLLYSDESTDWMTEVPEFTGKWAGLMISALSKGNRIKIIHTVSRDLDEMLSAIMQWMPLYMSGAIEPYYYPKKRDGVFKKTLFISPGISAVVSSSTGAMIGQAANMLIRNEAAIDAFTAEFNQYLSQCKPLMRIFSSKEDEKYFETLNEFEKEKSDSILKTESLSLLTMPDGLESVFLHRLDASDMNVKNYLKQRKRAFEEILKTNRFFEIIPKYDLARINQNEVKVSFSDMLKGGVFRYTKEEYVEHLDHIAYLLRVHKNYHIKMIDGSIDSTYTAYAKDDIGAIVAKTSVPPVILAINEVNLASAFWDYLISTIGERDYHHPNDKEELKKLNEYINWIKSS
ncbi:MAG TPA: transcriptional regulator [Lachnospiraceae bacterium]|jgi:hypothetical protein|nr:hypothetical protein [Bacteroidaceae bacterium]HUM84409.1 transcriptional regulator [Lachnospiraceae bacterium]